MGRARGWNWLVALSGAVVILLSLALGIGYLASTRSSVTNYTVAVPLRRVDLRLASGSAVVVGSSSSTVQVRRTDSYSFGHSAREDRSIRDGTLAISSRCPRIIVGSCSSSYELAVPETVAVDVQTASGSIHVIGYRGTALVKSRAGSVDVEAYCGFTLSAASGSGHVHVSAACSPRHLSLFTGSGNATALVPPGRYRINAIGAAGKERVTGLIRDAQAPFTIDAHSATGRVAVEGGL
jgi:hypothetical protein